jgi:site-specific recombinase XerD
MTNQTKPKQQGTSLYTPKTITSEEGDKLIKYLHSHEGYQLSKQRRIRNTAMGVLMLDAGLRRGELVQLRRGSLWLDDAPVDNLYIEARITKTHSARTIPLTNRIKIAIKEMQECIWSVDHRNINSFAFYTNNNHEHITVRQIHRIITAASKAAIGRAISPHVLRHTFASRMMRVAPTRVVQQLLGHKSLTSTQVYTHPNGDDLENAVKAYEG